MTNIGHGVDKRWRHFKSISTIFKKFCNFSLVHVIKVCKKQNLSPNVFASSLSILSPLIYWLTVLFWLNQHASVLKLSWCMDFGQNLTKCFEDQVSHEGYLMSHWWWYICLFGESILVHKRKFHLPYQISKMMKKIGEKKLMTNIGVLLTTNFWDFGHKINNKYRGNQTCLSDFFPLVPRFFS